MIVFKEKKRISEGFSCNILTEILRCVVIDVIFFLPEITNASARSCREWSSGCCADIAGWGSEHGDQREGSVNLPSTLIVYLSLIFTDSYLPLIKWFDFSILSIVNKLRVTKLRLSGNFQTEIEFVPHYVELKAKAIHFDSVFISAVCSKTSLV